MIDALNKVLETIGRPFEMIITNILKMGDVKMGTNKQTIIVTNGEYKDRVFDAVIGKDVAFVEIADTIHTIPEGSFQLFTAKGGIPEAFDTDGSMYVPPRGETGPEAIKPLGGIFKGESIIPLVGMLDGIRVTPAIENVLAKAGAEIAEEAKNRTPIGYLEDWPNPGHSDDVENNGDNVDKMEAVIKALRERSAKKAESNVLLSNRNDILEKTIKEVNRDMDGVIRDNNRLKEENGQHIDQLNRADKTITDQMKRIRALETELKEIHALNKHHVDEIEKGNQYRTGIKRTVEELHTQIRDRDEKVKREALRANEAEAELDRYKRIVDHITKKPSF